MKSVIYRLVATDDSWSSAVVRLFLGAVILPHGLQKTLGMFGGHGFAGTMGFFTGTLGVPAIVAFMVILAESVGALSLILGFAARFCAASLILVMAGAISMAHLPHGFFMNWSGNQQGEGYEYHLLVIGMALAVVIAGAGKASIDRLLTKKME